ncbi:MAG: beta-lactamase family protein [Micrococcales bacterium]|nr:beta-lactamase family protein [Micrococcales bacterium]
MRIGRVLTATMAAAMVLGGAPAVNAVQPAKKQPPSFDTTIREGRKAVRSALKQTKSTSASVALVSDGKVVWSQTFGRINPAGKKPSPTTQFGVGSVSKVVTTMAVMQLVDAGKVSLDAPVTRYIPDFSMKSPQYRQITVRMLLNHSAGVPGTDYADAWSNEPIPSYVDRALGGLANSHLKTTPGAMNVYCNDCFTLAGEVVERVSGVPFQDYVTANILKPLGMGHSRYQTSVPAPGNVAPIIQGGKAQPIEITNLFASVASSPRPKTWLSSPESS